MAEIKVKKKKPFNLNAKLTSAIRRVWKVYPLRMEAIVLARDPNKPKHLICARCRLSIHEKLMSVDHIQPVVPIEGTDSWDVKVNRTFYPEYGVSGLQCLCEDCHKQKTMQERQEKSALKKALKPAKVKKERKKKIEDGTCVSS